MPSLHSLHIGVNSVDPTHYGTDAPLRGCENDARDMQKIAKALGYQTDILLTSDATTENLFNRLGKLRSQLVEGDTLLLTLACHGSQLPDKSGDEDDKFDETWCLFDRMLIDDEVFSTFAQFSDGVRVIVISDSCHAGTSTRLLISALEEKRSIRSILNFPADMKFRSIEPYLDHEIFDENLREYEEIKAQAGSVVPDKRSLGPSVVLLAACQDSQTAGDGKNNGWFTENLKAIWADGAFSGNYESFRKKISDSMNTPSQVPNLYPYGPSYDQVLKERPFGSEMVSKKKGRDSMIRKNTNLDPAKENKVISSNLHPSVVGILKTNGFASLGPRDIWPLDLQDRTVEGGCYVKFDRSILDGKSDKEILSFFMDTVAPEICGNYFTARDAFSGKAPRGGSVSCSASTSGGGSVSCTGTWSF